MPDREPRMNLKDNSKLALRLARAKLRKLTSRQTAGGRQKRVEVPALNSSVMEFSTCELFEEYGDFVTYQLLAKCLKVNPVAKIHGEERPVTEWPYEQLPECQLALDQWAREHYGTLYHSFIASATTTLQRMRGQSKDYRQVLWDILQHLKYFPPKRKYRDADLEIMVGQVIMEEAIRQIEKLPPKKQKRVNKSLAEHLEKQGVMLGKESPLSYLKDSAFTAGASYVGTSIVTGMIISSMGLWQSALFTLGLYSIPTFTIGASFFVPIFGLMLVYRMGQHNFRKTIPFVAILADLRRRAIKREESG